MAAKEAYNPKGDVHPLGPGGPARRARRTSPRILVPRLRKATPPWLAAVLNDIAKARGVLKLAEDIGMTRQGLYKASSRPARQPKASTPCSN